MKIQFYFQKNWQTFYLNTSKPRIFKKTLLNKSDFIALEEFFLKKTSLLMARQVAFKIKSRTKFCLHKMMTFKPFNKPRLHKMMRFVTGKQNNSLNFVSLS